MQFFYIMFVYKQCTGILAVYSKRTYMFVVFEGHPSRTCRTYQQQLSWCWALATHDSIHCLFLGPTSLFKYRCRLK